MLRRKIKLIREYVIDGEPDIKEVKKFGTGTHITLSSIPVGTKVVIGVLRE